MCLKNTKTNVLSNKEKGIRINNEEIRVKLVWCTKGDGLFEATYW